jgi:hypothetical protein
MTLIGLLSDLHQLSSLYSLVYSASAVKKQAAQPPLLELEQEQINDKWELYFISGLDTK